MNSKEIKSLLEKHYNGNTSSEEEKRLIEYFSGQNIYPEFYADKEYFDLLKLEKDELLGIEDLSDQIWNGIENYEKTQKHKSLNFNKISRIILAVAASLIIIAVSVTLIRYEFFPQKKEIQFADTYQDPEKAYQEAKKALLLISEKLNKGTDQIKTLQSFDKGTKNLGLMENFDKGLYELKPVKSIDKADKYLKNK